MSTMRITDRFLRTAAVGRATASHKLASAGERLAGGEREPKRKTIWTPIRRAGLETGLRLNLTPATIASDLGLTEKQVTDYIEQHGLGRRGWASVKREPVALKPAVMLAADVTGECRRLREKGWSIAGLARRYGVPEASIAFAIGEPVEPHTTQRRA